MAELLVRGLEDERPGDIVGAVVGEADVAAEDVGNIDLDGTEATVEVADEVADRVVVGDSFTVAEADVYDAFVDHARERGRVVRPE